MAYKVLIPQDITEAGKEYLREKGYEIKMGSGITVEAIKQDVVDCDAILARTAPFPAEVLEAGKNLKVIGRHGIGVDNIDVARAEELGIWVTNAPLSNANSVAEHTITLILASARNLAYIDKVFRNGDFEIRNRLKGMDLDGKTLGLVGLGRIGTMVAKKAALGLGMKVIGYDPYITKDKVAPEIEFVDNMETIFKNADFVSLHMPATKETKGSIGKKYFEMMKSSAFLINCARGEVVDELELIQALKDKAIAGAALDVFEQEPPEKDNALFALDNVIVTPHNAALTQESMDRMGLHAATGIDEVLSGKKPSWPVNNPKL
ncbi:hydroxyacid dehydrogenase [Petroclostridium sp. X23]|uniref:hydroxyacid dehydrogenase n=1 Tax=Petroclostridium sp. X23 TaxID=3045146 RepID=UPI0024AD9FD0|nr:hydroxyacid dehydrogenase [Petroclostridium sp. X23]WHH57625.1 hydroxyacid dehydrogenase [Petroclostridium sp. X23]